ncbi:MAG TPA: hypothetical protein VJT31_36060 [Rugosimonospora sp.]|nr:hypothetical protein [Rugosimonospora sp.]
MAEPDGAVAGTRVCVVADLGGGTLMADLGRLEDLLLTLAAWADEAAAPDGDGWRPPGPLAGDTALTMVRRLQAALRPTQTNPERDGRGDWHDRPPAGPSWCAADGRYQLAALSFVPVAAADIELLGQVAGELGRPGGDFEVRAAIDQLEQDLPRTANRAERERCGLVATAARVHGLLDLQPTTDTALLHAAARAAEPAGEEIVLTAVQEAAYHRTVDRITAMAIPGDALTRWAMGTRDRS